MTADDLNAPLGQQLRKRRLSIPINASQALAGALALFLGVFVLWAVLGNNPFGGEPMVVVPVDLRPGIAAKPSDGPGLPKVVAGTPDRYDGPPVASTVTGPAASPPAPATATKTITIIDGKTGERQ